MINRNSIKIIDLFVETKVTKSCKENLIIDVEYVNFKENRSEIFGLIELNVSGLLKIVTTTQFNFRSVK